MNLYAFDVDETLELSGGPVTLDAIYTLRANGHLCGLCGNWGLVTQLLGAQGLDWTRYFNFFGPVEIPKPLFLAQIQIYVPAHDYVLVGNDYRRGTYVSPNDAALALQAGWRFISEIDFAWQGAR